MVEKLSAARKYQRAATAKPEQPSLLILNQMAGPMTWELAEDLGELLGSLSLLTGHPDTLAKGGNQRVKIYSAPAYQRGSFWRRSASWGGYVIRAFFWLLKMPATTPLLLFSNPPILPWLGWLVKKLRGQPYAVMVHDIYPEVLTRLGALSARHPLLGLWRRLNRLAYENAQVVMTLGEAMAANLERQFDSRRTPAGRVEVIYPWADGEKIKPLPKEENWFARQHGQLGKLTVMYSGNMGLGHDIETMLEAAQSLQAEADIHFMFIGAGPKWASVERLTRERGLRNISLLPWQPEETLPFSLAAADVALVSLEAGLEDLAIPSKAIYFLAAGAALIVLSHPQSQIAQWAAAGGSGACVPPGDALSLAQAILSLQRDPQKLARLRRQAARQARERFSRQRMAPWIAETLKLDKPG